MPAGHTETIIAWKSKWLSNEIIKTLITANDSLSPKLKWHNSRIRAELKGSCLKQTKGTFAPRNVVNLYIAFKLGTWSQDLNADFTLKDCLLGAAELIKNADPDNYSYSRYGIGFDSCSF